MPFQLQYPGVQTLPGAGGEAEAEGSGADVVTIKFDARVKDIAANVRGTKITNHALFKFEDNPEAGRTVELPDDHILRDVDYPDDYRSLPDTSI